MNERKPKRIARQRRKQKRIIRPTTQRSPVPDDFRSCGERKRRSLTTPEQVEMSACSEEVRCVPCARHTATRCCGIGTSIIDEITPICQSKGKKARQMKGTGCKREKLYYARKQAWYTEAKIKQISYLLKIVVEGNRRDRTWL